jgi:hypothetical protein
MQCTSMTIDTASNNRGLAGELTQTLKSKGWNAEHSLFPCFAHILKVSVQASLGDETFVWIVDRVCSLATVPLMYQCLSFRPNLLR